MEALPKVLLVADRPHWAYATLQDYIIRNLKGKYDLYTDFLLFHSTKRPRNLRARLSYGKSWIENRKYVRTLARRQPYDLVVYLGFYFPFYGEFDYVARRVIKGIYTDGFPPQCILPSDAGMDMDSFVSKYLSDADAVACGSRLIYERYGKVCRRCYMAAGGGDPDLFRRITPWKRNEGPRFVVGWTGNPNRPFKGFHDFVVPAVEAARQKRAGIVLKTRFEGPLHTLPRFYDDVDVVLIASDADAGPSLFDEACGCQVPAVSTAVGSPLEVIQPGKNGLLVPRDVGQMADALVCLYDHRDVLFSMAQRIRADWLTCTQRRLAGWIHMFDRVLQG